MLTYPITLLAPTDITLPLEGNILTWLKGNDASTVNGGTAVDGDPVDTWADFLGNNDATQATPSSKIIWKTTYMQGDISTFLTLGDIVSKIPISTIFVVLKDPVAGTVRYIYGDISGGLQNSGNVLISHDDSNYRDVKGDGTDFRITGSSDSRDTNIKLISNSYTSGGGSGLSEMEIDGSPQTEVDEAGIGTTVGGTKFDFSLFRPGESNSSYFTGRIYEFIFYNVNLSVSNRLIVTNYLKSKYNIL